MGAEGTEPAHDVLAAEEFALPTPDPALSHQPMVLPDDPSGISRPHDILAAEEFAIPVVSTRPRPPGGGAPAWPLSAAVAGLLALVVIRRLTHN